MIERERGKPGGRASGGESTNAITVDGRLELEKAGTKYRVEAFEVTIENASTDVLTVDRILLAFDDEKKTATVSPVDVDPGGTETIDVRWDWIYPDQDTLTVEPRFGDETLARADVDLAAYT